MKRSDKIFFLALALLLTIGGIIGLCAFAQIRTPQGTISVTGRGEMQTVADELQIHLRIYVDGNSGYSGLREEIRKGFDTLESVLAELGITYTLSAGANADDIYYYNYGDWGSVEKYFSIELMNPEDFARKSEIQTAVSEIPSVTFQGFSYYVHDGQAIKQQVRQKAYLDAQDIAKATADLLGVKLVKIHSTADGAFPFSDYYGSRTNRLYLDSFTGSLIMEVTMTYSIK